ncbi:hypothetical protein PAHAL_1G335700 [Panicum hallii]|uniref:Uncharacterized protein n=1 Tax=Panicum hallii TaxID=206008 RepID=A0A2T8KX39_9POAL|nr:hypothetical protein PAHAL_1G335700 [Panicum hallii]
MSSRVVLDPPVSPCSMPIRRRPLHHSPPPPPPSRDRSTSSSFPICLRPRAPSVPSSNPANPAQAAAAAAVPPLIRTRAGVDLPTCRSPSLP